MALAKQVVVPTLHHRLCLQRGLKIPVRPVQRYTADEGWRNVHRGADGNLSLQLLAVRSVIIVASTHLAGKSGERSGERMLVKGQRPEATEAQHGHRTAHLGGIDVVKRSDEPLILGL